MKIEFNNVSFRYNKNADKALNNVNLVFEKNEIVFILGSTGSGKSTLVNHMNGLLFANEGSVDVTLDDKSYKLTRKLTNIQDIRRSVGVVFQLPENQLFESNVLKEVMFGPVNFGASEEGAKKAAVEALEMLGVRKEYYNLSPFKLSGGEKRKVAISSVLACKPKVLIFDEPTASLDHKASIEFFEIVKELKNQGHMIIVISHNIDLAYEYGDRVVIMNRGNVLYDGDCHGAFVDKNILEQANIELPFIVRVKEHFNVKEGNTIKELAQILRGDSI